MGTHLKEELTGLFWKLPGYSMFPQEEQEENGEHFVNDQHYLYSCFGVLPDFRFATSETMPDDYL